MKYRSSTERLHCNNIHLEAIYVRTTGCSHLRRIPMPIYASCVWRACRIITGRMKPEHLLIIRTGTVVPGTRYSYCTYNCSRYYTSTGYEYWYEYVLRDTSRIQYRPANKETPIWSEPQIIICCSRPGHFLISRFLSTEGIETCFSYVYGFFLFMPDIRKG